MTSGSPHAFTPDEKKELEKSVDTFKRIFAKRNIDIKEIIGLVTQDELARAKHQISIKLAEGSVSSMNMIAFENIAPEELKR
jgi:hypothetical protein